MGLADYSALTGNNYNSREELKTIPQFIYIGEEDTEATYFNTYPTSNDISIWEGNDPVRLENQVQLLKENGYNVKFESYPETGHITTDAMNNDVWTFLLSNM